MLPYMKSHMLLPVGDWQCISSPTFHTHWRLPRSAVLTPGNWLQVGQYVYCFGAPQPDNPTLSVGVVSGFNRSFPSASGNRIYGALQVPAPPPVAHHPHNPGCNIREASSLEAAP
jgi:hypothetical protein